MKVLVTGTAGRVGRGIYVALMRDHHVVGLDRLPCSTADLVGDFRNRDLLESALSGVEVVVHVAGLHAPHVGVVPEAEFRSINVEGTKALFTVAQESGIRHLVFTSTTALYGQSITPENEAAWVDEKFEPVPRTIYHRTKIEAEQALESFSREKNIPVTVLQMSRCFPEPADLMAVYRLTRGVDARDVASAHLCAVEKRLSGFRRFIISGATPFAPEHSARLFHDAAGLIQEMVPELAAEFARRGWELPTSLDRVYDSRSARNDLGWSPRFGFESVLEMLDLGIPEVLPVTGC